MLYYVIAIKLVGLLSYVSLDPLGTNTIVFYAEGRFYKSDCELGRSYQSDFDLRVNSPREESMLKDTMLALYIINLLFRRLEYAHIVFIII